MHFQKEIICILKIKLHVGNHTFMCLHLVSPIKLNVKAGVFKHFDATDPQNPMNVRTATGTPTKNKQKKPPVYSPNSFLSYRIVCKIK